MIPSAICGGLSVLSIVLLLTVLSLAPGILMTVTSFTRFIVVLSLLRSAIGTQTAPPNAVISGLSLFLTGIAEYVGSTPAGVQPVQPPSAVASAPPSPDACSGQASAGDSW